MSQSSTQTNAFDGLSTLRQVLELLANIRNLVEPLTSAAGLEQALTSLVQLANLLGVSATWTAQLQSILTDPTVFNIVLLVVQQLLGSGSQSGTPSPSPSPVPEQTQAVAINEQTLSQWLPFATEISGLVRMIRGEQ
jgi:hypothetical protein